MKKSLNNDSVIKQLYFKSLNFCAQSSKTWPFIKSRQNIFINILKKPSKDLFKNKAIEQDEINYILIWPNKLNEEFNRRINRPNIINSQYQNFYITAKTMGAACGSARDSSTPSGGKANSQVSRNKNRKLTSLDDVIEVKQRRSVEIRLSESEKKKLFDRKFSVKK